ncbi:MAG: pdhB [Solirubrobacterales bacterium]|nr:pdhB [Solirubrobacterales bacterium]
MAEWTMQEALNAALADCLADDDRTLILGEDVGRNGGVFRVTAGLQERFGEQRVFDTPLAEAGILGTAVGLCMHGFRPIAEMQFDGFTFPAFNQLAAHVSKLRTRSGGALNLPLTLRVPSYGAIRSPEHHSESIETFCAHLPSIKVVSPSTPSEAYALLRAAVADPDPVVFLEPKSRYWSREERVAGDDLVGAGARQSGADADAERGDGYASRIVRSGSDVTLIAWGACVQRCVQAAAFAAEDGVEVEVLDLRWLKPLDVDGLVASVARTRRAVVVHEAPVTLGLGAEVAALLGERLFGTLAAPVGRVGAPDMPYPVAALEDEYLPSPDRILLAIQRTFDAVAA